MQTKIKLIMKKLLTIKKIIFFSFLFPISLILGCADQNPSASLTVSDYPESDSETVKLYLEKCGSCHAAPLPSIHNKKQWFGVVQRMQFRMTNKAIKPLNQQELALIVDYLQKHARDK